MINILIRTSGRPKGFARCLKSITDQQYSGRVKLIVSVDTPDSNTYAHEQLNAVCREHENISSVMIHAEKGNMKYLYNTYLNDMMQEVKEGWMLILDDDDELAHDRVLARLEEETRIQPIVGTGPLVNMLVFQMQRGDIIKPWGMTKVYQPICGQIGMPCFLLHHTLKNVASFRAKEDADYQYISEVMKRANYRTINEVMVNVSKRGHGEPEPKYRNV